MSQRKTRRRSSLPRGTRYYVLAGVLVVAAISGYLLENSGNHFVGSGSKPVILYVNQGNGFVNQSNFGALLSTAKSHGFNTIFFQVYRTGTLLLGDSVLSQLVTSTHDHGLKIFFALYFTNTTQTIPTSIYSDGEDGISLDMSNLPLSTQTTLFDQLSSGYSGRTAITTLDFTLPLRPDLLVLETYAPTDQPYIRPGIIASVEVAATASQQEYANQVQYAVSDSDGVMVFDYHGLVKAGY